MHHTLQKQLSRAIAAKDSALAESIQSQIDGSGGLELYQTASINGQKGERGGDSSRVLMDWVSENRSRDASETQSGAKNEEKGNLRLLEVGALRIDNACSQSKIFDVERIDLHSQHAEILEQDFMARPLIEEGEKETQGFDVVSLSLVVNYVGDATGRGEMLKRVSSFLRESQGQEKAGLFPCLFLVLPSPCVLNSRYLDESRLTEIMVALGYSLTKRKLTNKLVYYLWRRNGQSESLEAFDKKEVRKGKDRNNFAIILR